MFQPCHSWIWWSVTSLVREKGFYVNKIIKKLSYWSKRRRDRFRFSWCSCTEVFDLSLQFSIIYRYWGLSTGLGIGAYLRAYFACACISLNILTFTSVINCHLDVVNVIRYECWGSKMLFWLLLVLFDHHLY